MRVLRAPRVRRGDAFTATLWNQMADAVNEGLAGPKDLDQGSPAQEADEEPPVDARFDEVSRTEVTERIFSDVDPEVFIDVAKIETWTARNSVDNLNYLFTFTIL